MRYRIPNFPLIYLIRNILAEICFVDVSKDAWYSLQITIHLAELNNIFCLNIGATTDENDGQVLMSFSC